MIEELCGEKRAAGETAWVDDVGHVEIFNLTLDLQFRPVTKPSKPPVKWVCATFELLKPYTNLPLKEESVSRYKDLLVAMTEFIKKTLLRSLWKNSVFLLM